MVLREYRAWVCTVRAVLRRLLVALAVAGALYGVGTVWIYGNPSDTACVFLYDDLPELSEVRRDPGLWPPGTKCKYTLPSGETATRHSLP